LGLKFDLGPDSAGKRRVAYETVRGTKKEAEVQLAARLSAVDESRYVEANKTTVADFVGARIDYWEANSDIGARTAARYRELLANQIKPHLGAMALQKLKAAAIEDWYVTLRKSGRAKGQGGLAPRTIRHCHRLLSKALRDAARLELVAKNVLADQKAPKVKDEEMVIVKDVPAFVERLRGHRLFVPAMVALFTGMRIGEVREVRWSRVDLVRNVIEVAEALEQTKAHGSRLKAPKSEAGRRTISLPDVLVDILREYRAKQLELRVKLGAGKLPDDALLFAGINGELPSQKYYSRAFSDLANQVGMPRLSFHGLRHTHASQLIDAGVDIVTISKRLGHAKPDITLRVYAHMFRNDDSKAAEAINTAMSRR
jgi:integrase